MVLINAFQGKEDVFAKNKPIGNNTGVTLNSTKLYLYRKNNQYQRLENWKIKLQPVGKAKE